MILRKYSVKYLEYAGVEALKNPPDWIVETLQAHFRSRDEHSHKIVQKTSPQPDHVHHSSVEIRHDNGACDLASPPEFVLNFVDEPCYHCTHDSDSSAIALSNQRRLRNL
jgi:hypothetical protein